MEAFHPLHVRVCERCHLVQLEEYVSPEHIFSEYAYFSSYSDSWLKHASNYVEMISDRLGLGGNSLAVELASNDGYLLQYFVKKGIPVLGVEPAVNVAKVAETKGVPTLVKFFGCNAARQMIENGQAADLIIGNNVLAQVPDLNDFVGGIRILLKPGAVATLEFPHLERLTSLLLTGNPDRRPVSFRNGGVVCLEKSGATWSLVWAIVPDLLRTPSRLAAD